MTTKDASAYPQVVDGEQRPGVSKREYFAAMALSATHNILHVSPQTAAKQAVSIADAIIEELNK